MAEPTKPAPDSFFIENVEDYVKQNDVTPDVLLNILDREYKKFKYLESRLLDQKANLAEKVPEIQRTLDIVEHLKAKGDDEEPTNSHFELTNGIWAEGQIKKDSKSVFLWLGANVMVEYSYDEATDVLTKNLNSGKEALQKLTTDLAHLKDQITIAEVNISRVYNYGIKLKKSGQVAPQ